MNNPAHTETTGIRQSSWMVVAKSFPIYLTVLAVMIALCSRIVAADDDSHSVSKVMSVQGLMVATESLSLSNATISSTYSFSAWVRRNPYGFRIEVQRQPAGNSIYSISEHHTWSLSNAVVCFDFRNTNYSPDANRTFLLSHFQPATQENNSLKMVPIPSSSTPGNASGSEVKAKHLSSSGIGQIIPGSVPVGTSTFSDLVWLAFCSSGYFSTNPVSRCPPIGERIEKDEPGPWFLGETIIANPQSFLWFPQEVEFRSTGMYYFRGAPPIGIQLVQKSANGHSKWKPYAPPFDKGFLRATYRVHQHTNLLHIKVPLKFDFKAFLPDYPKQNVRQRYVVTGTVTNCFTTDAIPDQETVTKAPAAGIFFDFRVPVNDRGQPTQIKLAEGEEIPKVTAVVASSNHIWQKARIQRTESEPLQDRRSYLAICIIAFVSIAVLIFIFAVTKNIKHNK